MRNARLPGVERRPSGRAGDTEACALGAARLSFARHTPQLTGHCGRASAQRAPEALEAVWGRQPSTESKQLCAPPHSLASGLAFIAVVQSTFIAGSGFVTQMAAARKSSDDDTEKAEEMAEESLKDD